MTRSFTVAAAQLGPSSDTKAQTVERMVGLIQEAGRRDVELLTFSELSLTPYFATRVHAAWQDFLEDGQPSAVTQPLFEAGRQAGLHWVFPFAERENGQVYNTAVLVDPTGAIVQKYRKAHIPGVVEPRWEGLDIFEKRYFTEGNLGFPVTALRTGESARLGMLICYDRRFSEAYRALALGGAELICIPYNTPTFGRPPAEGHETAEILLRAAAIENQVFIVAAGKAGVEDGVEYIGGSEVISPEGKILAKAQTAGDELVVTTIDLDALAQLKARWDFMPDRRPELYQTLADKDRTAAASTGK
jgi:predicted amidohydrolase